MQGVCQTAQHVPALLQGAGVGPSVFVLLRPSQRLPCSAFHIQYHMVMLCILMLALPVLLYQGIKRFVTNLALRDLIEMQRGLQADRATCPQHHQVRSQCFMDRCFPFEHHVCS